MTNLASTGSMQIGDIVCRVGRTTGHICGFIKAIDRTKESEIGGVGSRNIDHQWVMDDDAMGGDSGAPYFIGTEAWGIHTHSKDPGEVGHPESWYSPTSWTIVEYQNRFGITFRYCVTDGCA